MALDAKGQSVLDLGAADFHVWDNGEPQTISSLRLTREQRDAAMNDGYSVTEDLAVSSHVEQIRAIVFDIGSAAIGSLSVPVRK